MKRVIIIIVSILIGTQSLIGQSKKIDIQFVKNGKEIALKDDFSIYFVAGNLKQKVIFVPEISDNSFIVPDFGVFEKAHFVFKHKSKFYDIEFSSINYMQNMRWVIGFDKKPFNKEYKIDSIESKDVRGVIYIEYKPLEQGQGVVSVTNIINIKKYFKYGKELVLGK